MESESSATTAWRIFWVSSISGFIVRLVTGRERAIAAIAGVPARVVWRGSRPRHLRHATKHLHHATKRRPAHRATSPTTRAACERGWCRRDRENDRARSFHASLLVRGGDRTPALGCAKCCASTVPGRRIAPTEGEGEKTHEVGEKATKETARRSQRLAEQRERRGRDRASAASSGLASAGGTRRMRRKLAARAWGQARASRLAHILPETSSTTTTISATPNTPLGV